MPTTSPTPSSPPLTLSAIRERALSFSRGIGFPRAGGEGGGERPAVQPDLAIIDQLCAWSFSPEPQLARAATAAIFCTIIEPLCDDFSARGVALANLVLTRILQYIRVTPQGAELDRLLSACGFSDAKAILDRYQAISHPTPLAPGQLARVHKVIILSRVTAGADIAITNVIIHRLRARFPAAELVLIGPAHLPEIFASVPNCRHRPFLYRNDGTLFDKMTSWPQLLTISQEEQAGQEADEVLLFDPDTRLTQLGLLPLAPDRVTCYFPSRNSEPQGQAGRNLSSLTNQWLNLLLDEQVIWHPNLVFQRHGEGFHRFCQGLRQQGCRQVIAINFGVGNDPRKRVHGSFEEDLIQDLLTIPETIVILDTGRSLQKGQWMANHLARVRQQGWPAACLTETEITSTAPPFGHGLIIFQGSLGALGKMIDAADCFIGYDSCGQHLAAATSTPSVIVFAGAPSTRFIERWSPDTPATLTIPFDSQAATPEAIRQLIRRITQAVAGLRECGGCASLIHPT